VTIECTLSVKTGWKALWSSPGLNPVDCSIGGALQQLVFHPRYIRDVEHLKEVLQTCWEKIGQDIINRSLLQPVEDTLSTAFINVFGAYTYIIMLMCFVVEIQNLDNKNK